MNSTEGLWSSLANSLEVFWTALLGYAPTAFAVIVIVVAGWLVAHLARRIIRGMTNTLHAVMDRIFHRGAMANVRPSHGAMSVLGELVFWIILLLVAAIAAHAARLGALADWLGGIVSHLPNILIGIGIIVLGYVLSVLLGHKVEAVAQGTRAGYSALLGKMAQAGIFVAAVVIGLDLMGFDVTILIVMLTVMLGAVAAGLAIAFGFGARDHVGNLIAARTAQRELTAGQMVRIGEAEGVVLEVTRTHIALDTREGRWLVPTRMVDLHGVVLTTMDPDEGAVDD